MNDRPAAPPSTNRDYATYLGVPAILSAAKLLTDTTAESLFVRVHQSIELFLAEANGHLRDTKRCLQGGDTAEAVRLLRVVTSVVVHGMGAAWPILRELRPQEFNTVIRPHLGSASGFQSAGHREFEFHLGAKDTGKIAPLKRYPDRYQELLTLASEASVWDEFLALLSRRGFLIDPAHIGRDKSLPYESSNSVVDALLAVYLGAGQYPDLYVLAETLLDLDHHVQRWRFNHLKIVQRQIGTQRGTHGTAGVGYLASIVETQFFPELWVVPTRFGERKS